MNRHFDQYVRARFTGISALGMASLGFLWYSPTGATPPGKQEGEWRLLDPLSYENLTVFPVVSSSGYDTSSFLTLEAGLSSGEVHRARAERGPLSTATVTARALRSRITAGLP